MHDVIVANGVWHGGGMKLAPDAAPDDGQFDVVLIGDVSKVDFLTTAPKIYKGKHVHHPKVEVLRSARVEVDAPVQLPIELEGEQVGTTPATFEVVPGALRVRVPSGLGGSVWLLRGSTLRASVAPSSFLSRCSSSPMRFSIALEPAHALREVVDAVLQLRRRADDAREVRVLRRLADHLFAEAGQPVECALRHPLSFRR